MRFWLALAFVALPVLAVAQTADPDPGIPLDVADARAAQISNLRYDLTLTIPEQVSAPVEGTNRLAFDLASADEPLVIDFATSREHVRSVTANERAINVVWTNGHILIPKTALKTGANLIEIGFRAGDASLNRNPDFLYTLFVPARAHLAIPCFDQPNLKAKWSLTLEGPAKWQLVSNGAEVERKVAGDRATVRFAETAPLSTYLFSFVAGDFKIETAQLGDRTFRMFHRETDAAKVARNKDAIFDLHAKAIEFLESYTTVAYAFGKFDFVLIPSFQFGGMEHAGKILYNASGLLLDESATQNQYLGRASVIAHETAHMWFGDLVTMRWFNDVWMKEVFANFMAAKIVNPSFPEVNHELRFLLAHYPAAYEIDRTPGTNAIRQPLANLNEAGSLYGAIIYQKAPIVMRHLESLMGETAFRDGLREYLRKYSFGNATWSDLIAILDARTPTDLAAWSQVWVEEAGRPAIATELEVSGGKIKRLAFRQSDPGARTGTPRIWPQQLRIALGYADRLQPMTVDFNGEVVEVADAAGAPAPLFVLPNAGGWSYGGFRLDRRSLAYLMASVHKLPDPVTRGAAWVTLWEALVDGSVTASAFVKLAQTALPAETDEQLTSRVLGYLGGAWWRFLPARESYGRGACHREAAARRTHGRQDVEPESDLVRGAAQREPDTADTDVAAPGVGEERDRARLDARRARLHQPRRSARGPRGPRLERYSERATGPDRESRSEGAVPVRDAVVVRGSSRARTLVRVAARRRQSPARALGPRWPQSPAPSAARRGVGEVRRSEPADALGDSEDGRHLFPQALDGRDARRPSVTGGRQNRPPVPERSTGRLSRSTEEHRLTVGR